MINDKKGLSFSIDLDLEQIKRKADEANNIIAGIGRNTEKHTEQLAGSFNRLGKYVAGAFSVTAGVSFAQQVIQVRTEIDSLERSFTSLLSSQKKAGELMSWIKEFAATTPLTIQGLASSAQTMIGFGIEAEKVTTYLKALGDISMGDTQRMNALALAFSQMSATGKLMGQDLLQMINAGFNPLSEISRKTGESVGSLKKRMNEIPLKEIQDAFISATQEGGKFNNMLKSQAGGLAGVQASLRDAINTQFNKIGEQYEDSIKKGYQYATKLVNSLDKVVPIVRDIIVAYGSYKAALISILAVEKAMRLATLSRLEATALLTAAQKRLNAVIAKNKYAIIAGLIAGLVTHIIRLKVFTDKASDAQERFTKTLQKVDDKINSQRSKAEELVNTIKNENETNYAREKAYSKLIEIYPDLIGHLDIEKIKTMELADAIKYLNQQRDKGELKELEQTGKGIDEQIRQLEGGVLSDGKFTLSDIGKGFDNLIAPEKREAELKELKRQREEIAKLISTKKEDQRISSLSTSERIAELEKEKDAWGRYIETRKKEIDELSSYKDLTKEEAEQLEFKQTQLKEYQTRRLETEDKITALREQSKKKQASISADEQKDKEKALKKQIELEKKKRDEQIRSQREYEDLVSQSIALDIQMMEEGAEKEVAILNEQHRLKMQQVEREMQDLKNAREDSGSSLTPEEINAFEEIKQKYVKVYQEQTQEIEKAQSDANQEVLQEYAGYLEQREKIELEHTKKVLDIRKAAEAEGVDAEPYLAVLAEQTQEALEQLDEHVAEKDATFLAWSRNIANMGMEALEAQLVKAEAVLATLEKEGKADEKKLAIARASVAKLREAIREVQANDSLEPSQTSIEKWQELYKTLDIASQGFERLGEEVGGVAGNILKQTGQIASSTLSMINGIKTLTESSVSAMEKAGKAGEKAMSTVEKASVILTIVSAGLQIAMKIASLFNKDKAHQKEIEALQGRIDQLQWELNNVPTLKLEKETGDPIHLLDEAMKKAVGTTRQLNQEFHEIGKEYGAFKAVTILGNRVLERSARNLVSVYSELDYTITKALGAEKYDAPKRELDNLAKQTLLLKKQKEEEESKKKSDKGRIDEYERQIRENATKMADVLNNALEDIMGGSVSSLSNQLGNAIVEAFAKGEDAAEAWHGKVKDIVKDIMKRMLISKLVEEPIGAIFNKYKKEWYKQDEFQGIDKVLASLPGLANEMNSAGGALINALENLDPALKSLLVSTQEVTEDREASKKGIATASQDSVDELNGRATAIQGHTYSIAEQTKMLVGITNSILTHVVGIHNNTDRLEQIEKDTKATRGAIEDISIKGIRIHE